MALREVFVRNGKRQTTRWRPDKPRFISFMTASDSSTRNSVCCRPSTDEVQTCDNPTFSNTRRKPFYQLLFIVAYETVSCHCLWTAATISDEHWYQSCNGCILQASQTATCENAIWTRSQPYRSQGTHEIGLFQLFIFRVEEGLP